MSDRVDEALGRFSRAVAQVSPDAHPLAGKRGRRQSAALVAFAGFVSVLVVGAISLALGLLGPSNQDGLTGEPIDLGERWEWMTHDAERVLGVLAIVDRGPQPATNMADLGERLALIPASALTERVGPPVMRPEAGWDIAYVGTIPETSTRVYAYYLSSGPESPGLCVATEWAEGGGSSCVYGRDSLGGGVLPFARDHDGTRAEVPLLVPEATAVVVAEFNDGRRIVQHPVGGVSVIQLDDAEAVDTVTLTAFSRSDDVLGRQTVTFPRSGDRS